MATTTITTTMLESYFEFVSSPADEPVQTIRIAGTRVGIEHVLREYLNGASPEELALRFPTVSLEQIHATITYFLAQRQQVTQYLKAVWRQQELDWKGEQKDPSLFVVALRQKLAAARRELHESNQFLSQAAD